MAESFRGVETDSIKLMRQLAKMANMEFAGLRKMVLVLEPDCMPVLYTEGYLQPVEDEQLPHVELAVVKCDEPIIVHDLIPKELR